MDEHYEENNLEVIDDELISYGETCASCGRFFNDRFKIKIGRGVCLRCASSGHERKPKKSKRRYNFKSPEAD